MICCLLFNGASISTHSEVCWKENQDWSILGREADVLLQITMVKSKGPRKILNASAANKNSDSGSES